MPIRYVSAKSTKLYLNQNGNQKDLVLIYGERVTTAGGVQNSRIRVNYRGRPGWVNVAHLSETHPLELYFIDVGQGDSTFIVTPDDRKILIDGGKQHEAYQFLVWKYRLDQDPNRVLDIDLLVVSHADADHIAGLTEIVAHPQIRVGEIIHNGIAKYRGGHGTAIGQRVRIGNESFLTSYHDSIADFSGANLTATMNNWYNAVNNEPNLTFRAVDQSTGTVDVGDPFVTLTVLGPCMEYIPNQAGPVFRWLGSAGETVNGHSVILKLEYNNVSILLPGDINERGSDYLMEDAFFAEAVDAHIFKAPHHGSHHYSRAFLEAVHPQVAIVSSGETPDYGHPRANFLGTIGNVSRSEEPLLFSTELVASFAVDNDAAQPDADNDVVTDPAMIGQARRRFKKRLNGLINVRTDGSEIFCARRIADNRSQFVTYRQQTQDRDDDWL